MQKETKTIFEKEYNSESLYDFGRDMEEAIDERFNDELKSIPEDEYGFKSGTFKVLIIWKNED